MTNQQKLDYFKQALPEIQQLYTHELDEFMRDQSIRNLPSDVMQFLMKAVDIRKVELLNTTNMDSFAVHSEITLQDL